jgi:hypothetical protein
MGADFSLLAFLLIAALVTEKVIAKQISRHFSHQALHCGSGSGMFGFLKITYTASLGVNMTGIFIFLVKRNPLNTVPITDPRWRLVHGHRPFLPAHNHHNVSFVVSLFCYLCSIRLCARLHSRILHFLQSSNFSVRADLVSCS